MRFNATWAIAVLVLACATIAPSPCSAQTRVTSLEQLQRELAAGDVVTVVGADGRPLAGRLTRVGDLDFDLRLSRPSHERGAREITIPLAAIQSLERPRDSVRNGVAIGAGIGAGIGGALFIYATVVDRNEIGEWAGPYVTATAIATGIGALIGWSMDSARSKPHIRFDASSRGRATVTVQPLYSRGPGVAVAVTLSR